MKVLPICISLVLVSTIAVCSPVCVYASALAKVTLKVVDEENKPIEGANARICFYGGCLKKDAAVGITDTNGILTSSGFSKDGQVGGAVEKAGYYASTHHTDFIVRQLGMWQPWNKEVTVVLRPIVNPVPMYVRDKTIEISYLGKEIGFDLMKFDWVMPYGQGVKSDFIFKVDKRFNTVDDFDVTFTMTFENEYDGIQMSKEDTGGDFSVGSRFRLKRNAPENGYSKTLTKRMSEGGEKSRNDHFSDANYFFRVRSEVDENGKLKRAMYGKIIGDIKLSPRTSKTLKIHMLYYLNPDYTRNMEFDPQRNLFSPLPKGEYPIGVP